MSGIREFVLSEPLFGTHDHQPPIGEWVADPDKEECFALLGYALHDLIIAGSGGKPWEPWTRGRVAPCWEFVRTTGYGKALEFSVQELFGLSFDQFDEVTDALQAFLKSGSRRDVYEQCFERANVIGVINDRNQNIEKMVHSLNEFDYPDFFKFVLRFERSAFPQPDCGFIGAKPEDFPRLEQELDLSIGGLAGLDEAYEKYFEQNLATGRLVALKIACAYDRHLDFENVSDAEAEKALQKLLKGEETYPKTVEDWLFHKQIRLAEGAGIPVQIHTGYLAGLGKDFRQGDPAELIPAIQQHPDARFDLFHASWPFHETAMAMGKQFPNVWLDMCWAWSMNPVASERILDEWLAAVPCNKFFAYGADICSPILEIGIARQTREGIAAVMERKIARGEYDLKTAEFVARRVMNQNAQEFFRSME